MTQVNGKQADRQAVRLAYHPEGDRTLSLGEPDDRLAYGNSPPERNGTSGLESPSVRLATAEGGIMYEGGSISKALASKLPSQSRVLECADTCPALLVSYVYLKPFLANRHRYHYRDWVLDSGAYSAHNSGTTIDIDRYIETCLELMESDPALTEVFALDVIGDWKASLKNCERMWTRGVRAIPAYHVGEPEYVLKSIARDYPKIALGGAVGYRAKDKWAAECFARVWPKAIHGFGFGGEKSVLALPWHSVDATNWEIGPCKYGRWNAFGKMSVRGSKQNLRAEVEYYLDLERRARVRWRKQMQQLEKLEGPTVLLALSGAHSADKKYALGDDLAFAPAVRRAAQQSSDSQIRRSGLESPAGRLAIDPGAASGQRAASTLAPTVRLAQKQSGREKVFE